MDSGRDFTLIDALPEDSYSKHHLPNALSMPSDTVETAASKKLTDKDRMIITYCGNAKCPKSREAAEKLESLGYTNVMEYEGGLEDWEAAGFPMESDLASEGKQPSAM
jgi:rhodanese-related sulfurtransferase